MALVAGDDPASIAELLDVGLEVGFSNTCLLPCLSDLKISHDAFPAAPLLRSKDFNTQINGSIFMILSVSRCVFNM